MNLDTDPRSPEFRLFKPSKIRCDKGTWVVVKIRVPFWVP